MIDLRKPMEDLSLPIREAAFPAPFPGGLEYAAPARGPWNIVHIGMLIPESHQIFVCAQGCLRGVVLTAAEMGAEDRFSTIDVRENNVLDGDMEDLIIDGVTDILAKLPYRPRALLIFTSCIHHFIGCDLPFVYEKLRERFPDIDFTDCYMNPIMRKTKVPPDAKMRQQLYSLLHPREMRADCVTIIGNNEATQKDSELMTMLAAGGYTVREITDCHTYDEYQELAESRICLSYNPAAVLAGQTLEERLSQKHLHLPLSYEPEEIRENLQRLAAELSPPLPDFAALEREAEAALARAREAAGDMPVAIDYTATSRPLGLAKLLIQHGFRVERVYVDAMTPGDRPAFEWLRENAGGLRLYPTVHAGMGMLPHAAAEEFLAIGQKAAYFTGTRHFVNLLEGGGHYGFAGIRALAEEIAAAAREEKDTEGIISVKGWGCCG